MAKRQVPHWQCPPRSQALSISSAAWRRLASHAGRSLRERILLQVSLYAIRAKKSRGGPGRPRTRTALRRRNSQIANDSLGFSAPERSKRKHTSLGHFLCIRLPQKKQVFQAHYDQRSAGHPVEMEKVRIGMTDSTFFYLSRGLPRTVKHTSHISHFGHVPIVKRLVEEA